MKITFLGTAASNAFPEAFCKCPNCEQARFLGGPSLRKRSAALVNDDLLIDLGPDIMTASLMHGCSLSNVQYCLQTHDHADHLDLSHLLSRSPGYGVVGAPCLHFYASNGTINRMICTFQNDLSSESLQDPEVCERLNLEIIPIEPFLPFPVGRYNVTALPANHDSAVDPMLFAIEERGRAIFYGTDTADLCEDSWRAFDHLKLSFDVVILDHTYGPGQETSDHLSARGLINLKNRLIDKGFMKQDGRVFATHISHEGNPAHPELAAFASRYGYEVPYDGLVLQI